MKKSLLSQWQAQKRRIQRFIKSAEARGFVIPPPSFKRPKRITQKSIQRLKSITPKALYAKSQYIDFSTGEVFTGEQGVRIENFRKRTKDPELKNLSSGDILRRLKASQRMKAMNAKRRKPAKTPMEKIPPDYRPSDFSMVYRQIFDELRFHPNGFTSQMLIKFFEHVFNRHGRSALMEAVERSQVEGVPFEVSLIYDSDDERMLEYIYSLMFFLPTDNEDLKYYQELENINEDNIHTPEQLKEIFNANEG